MASPTQRSLELLRSQGWTACTVEKWITQTKQRVDAFGFGDILACRVCEDGSGEIALIQSTTQDNMGKRIAKITGDEVVAPRARIWLRAGGRIIVHGWRKLLVKRGGKAIRCECDERDVTVSQFPLVVPDQLNLMELPT